MLGSASTAKDLFANWRRLKDKSLFNQVFVGYGTLVWPDEIDIGPEDVWEFAKRYN